ncbi:uncharacterized [Tachysurus ichikawai]
MAKFSTSWYLFVMYVEVSEERDDKADQARTEEALNGDPVEAGEIHSTKGETTDVDVPKSWTPWRSDLQRC